MEEEEEEEEARQQVRASAGSYVRLLLGGDEVGRRRELALVSGLRLCQGARASPVRRSIAICVVVSRAGMPSPVTRRACMD